MPEQVSLRILHPQVAELCANYKKRNRRLPPAPTLNWQALDQNKPTPVEYFIEGLSQLEPKRRQLNISGADSRKVLPQFFYLLYCAVYFVNFSFRQPLNPVITSGKRRSIPYGTTLNLRRQG
jgi:hypothetical protein